MSFDAFAFAEDTLRLVHGQPILEAPPRCAHVDAEPIGHEDALTILQCRTCQAIWTVPCQ